MRKISIFTIALVCAGFVSQAQVSKGSIFLGGSVGYFNRETELFNPQFPNAPTKAKQSSFSIMPQLGIALKENQILGISLSYSPSRNEQGNGTVKEESENSLYGGGVFYRRYFPISQRFSLFGDGNLDYRTGKGETTTPTGVINPGGAATFVSAKSKNQQVSLSLTPGLSFAASRKLFVETSFNGLLALTYNSMKADSFNPQGNLTQSQEEKIFSAGANTNGFNSYFAIGLRWILPSGK